jgi:MMP 1-O-methyltransferase
VVTPERVNHFCKECVMPIELPLDIESVKGFLDRVEGEALYRYALESSVRGPCFEIGSYCGKSTVYLGTACRRSKTVLFSLDHHRGSEEHQPGEAYHDTDLFDTRRGVFDSFGEFRRTLQRAGLEDTVVPLVTSSVLAARCWSIPLSLVFIDGGHSLAAALDDYRSWAGQVIRGGFLMIHDIFPNPADGGQAPFEIWQLALSSGLFEKVALVGTLGVLRRR